MSQRKRCRWMMPDLGGERCGWQGLVADRENKVPSGAAVLVVEAGHPRYYKTCHPCPRSSFAAIG